MSGEHLDKISKDVNRLAHHFNPHDPWVFLLLDKATGRFRVYSNQTASGIRDLAKKSLKPQRREEAP